MRYGKTFTRVHDPLVWREGADALLMEAGVQVVYHTTVVGALVEGGARIEGGDAYTKEGPATIRAKVTVDASGDADVVAMAGFPSFVGQDGRVKNPTMIFRLMGVDTARFLAAYGEDTIMGEEVSALIREKGGGNGYDLPRAKIWLFPTTHPGELLCNCTRVIGADGHELSPLIARDFTEAEIEGRRQVREYARFFRDHLVVLLRRHGIKITDVEVGSQLLVLDTRRELERLVSVSAARRATSEEREAHAAAARELYEVGEARDPIRYLRVHFALKKFTCACARNPYAARALSPLHALSRRFFYVHRERFGDLTKVARVHAELALAISRGDEAGAATASDAMTDYAVEFTRRIIING